MPMLTQVHRIPSLPWGADPVTRVLSADPEPVAHAGMMPPRRFRRRNTAGKKPLTRAKPVYTLSPVQIV